VQAITIIQVYLVQTKINLLITLIYDWSIFYIILLYHH